MSILRLHKRRATGWIIAGLVTVALTVAGLRFDRNETAAEQPVPIELAGPSDDFGG